MARIAISPFLGELPKIPPKLLPDNYAEQALNCDLSSMSLKPANQKALVDSFGYGTQSVFKHPNYDTWFRWYDPGVNMVVSPLNNDDWGRVYWTGDDYPKMATYTMANNGNSPPGSSYRLGIPAPASAMTASAPVHSEPPEEGGYEIDAVYVVTFISEYGEEGPPSPVSNLVTRWSGDSVDLSHIPSPPTGSHNITRKRLYRAETSGSFLYVTDLPASQSSWTDTVETELLGSPIPSIDWDAPDARMIGLTNIGNGILAGWFENTLCFSESYRPHAWPVGYQMGFDSDIVGIAPVTGGLVVATQRGPWLITGVSPAAMSQSKMDVSLGCVSRESMVDMGEYAIYASDDGLVAVGGGRTGVITEKLIARDQWQFFNPRTIHGFRWREKYLAFYEGEGQQAKAFIIDPEQGLVHLDADGLRQGWTDPATGELYVLNAQGELYQWYAGESGEYTWTSKIFTLPHRVSMAVGRIEADDTVSLTVFADGEELIQLEVADEQMFRLPAGRYRHWQLKLSGSAEVYSAQLAGNPTELL